MMFTHQSDNPAQAIVEQAMRSTLQSGSPMPLEVYSEYLDAVRTPLDEYEGDMVSQLKRKYRGKRFDLIFAINPPALNFALKNRAALTSGAPIVFLVLDQQNVSGLDFGANVTGVWGEVNNKSNLELALMLHPETKQLVVISGVGEWDNYWRAIVQEELRTFENRVEFSYLTGLTIAEQKTALAALPPRTVVLFVSSTRDHEGNNPGNLAVLREICPISNTPVYGTSDSQLGLGIVGGSLLSFEALGTEGAQVGLRVLAGETPEGIAPHGIPSVPMFDWRQLQRWGISEKILPAGSIIRFKQVSVWEEYRWYIIGLIGATTIETLLIGWLIFLRIRRRQAEAEAARLNSRLGEIVANVPGIVWESRTSPGTNRRTTTFISDYVRTMLGYAPDEWLEKPVGFGLELVPEEDRERVLRESDEVIATGKEAVSEYRWFTKDGRVRWVENHVAPIVEETGVVGLRGVALDITERKVAEDMARETEERNAAIVTAIPDLMFLFSPEGVYLDCHASNHQGLLMPPEKFLGKNMREMIPAELAERFFEAFERASENPGPQVLEYKLSNDLGERWYDARIVRTGDNFLSIVRDISERKAAEEAIREREERFRDMAESAPVMIWMSDENFACTYVNKRWLELTGSTLENELGSGWSAHFHPDDLKRSVEVFSAFGRERKGFENEFRIHRFDGQYRSVLSSAMPRFSPSGEFIGYIGSSIDITERKESEEELKKAHDELHKLKIQLEAENIYLQEELRHDQAFGEIVGQSAAIKYVMFKVSQVAPTDSTVLVAGETGTGKELVAHAIHEASGRKDRPLIKVNCAALSPSLIESELFGHEKGAFTGAGARRLGRFELANTGTLFLDEIGELPLELQGKLLRIIQEGEFERVGGDKTIKTDARIIASTNRNLKNEVEKGRFREDLWYRLNVFPITTPPLRERRDDIPLLTEHFAGRFSRKFGKEITAVSPDTMTALCEYSWPGNVRELANVIERSVINSRGPVLRIHEDFGAREAEILAASVKTLVELERDYITQVLEDLHWRIDGPNGAARVLGINPSTLRSRIAKLEIKKSNGRSPETSK